MVKCKSCGKDHGIVMEHRVTGKSEPLEMCYECMFKDWKPAPIETIKLEDLDENGTLEQWGLALMKAQDKIIREMIESSVVLDKSSESVQSP